MIRNQGKDDTLEPAYFQSLTISSDSGGLSPTDNQKIKDLENKYNELSDENKKQDKEIADLTQQVKDLETGCECNFEPISDEFINSLQFTTEVS